jgi:hypothetical protein
MVIKKQIQSVKDATDPRPWYEVHISSGRPEVVSDNDGGTNFDMSGTSAKTPSWSSLPDPAGSLMSSDAIYAVTESGEFIAYKPGKILAEEGISLRAHLAWYDSATDEFTVLEFVEE